MHTACIIVVTKVKYFGGKTVVDILHKMSATWRNAARPANLRITEVFYATALRGDGESLNLWQ